MGQTLTSNQSSERALSIHHYHYIDPATGTRITCEKCPAGTYISSHCTETSVRDCSRCPAETFTRGENGKQQCHLCRSHCQVPFIEKSPCTATTDRSCACPASTFALAGECRQHSLCMSGWGVRKRGSETEDVRCRRCLRGTFSDVASDILRCRPHTNCQAKGLVLLLEGTEERDNVCGPGASNLIESSTSSTDSAQGGKWLLLFFCHKFIQINVWFRLNA